MLQWLFQNGNRENAYICIDSSASMDANPYPDMDPSYCNLLSQNNSQVGCASVNDSLSIFLAVPLPFTGRYSYATSVCLPTSIALPVDSAGETCGTRKDRKLFTPYNDSYRIDS